ncbi:catalase family peroxidase [Paraburkholderia caballeronis]|uniref:catalase family peroxidase n=1 Tax=Paraburkholderia caballeronis TaxID=416943 RepID=UPI0010653CCF|nr:catalase family peroxidase [Paraburkholderia caballeronis]TDV13940.1 catalase [Paraburkholderia caballeronis]TDV15453.1 catalase [Paraburkholderia caballeronis]TDV24921.1 catalase [Paraburkholderia caballeronis]
MTRPTICVPCRLAAIAVAVGCAAAAFAWTAGWLTPQRLTAPHIINTFERNYGVHPGYRRNHAKGLCVEGWFDSNGNGTDVSRAAVFAPQQRTPVIGRFAIPGSNPSAPDASVPVRSLALLFRLSDGEQWRTGMNSTPVFAVHTPQQFYAQLVASKPDPATGKPDPQKLAAFFRANPDTQPFRQWVSTHPQSSSFANTAFYGINAFIATDAAGATHAVRWQVVPDTPFEAETAAQKTQPDFLANDLDTRLAAGPLRWHLILTVAAPGDPTDDATQQWPDTRERIDAGTLVLQQASPQSEGQCRDVNYDPTVLPDGLKPSDDPLLAARSAAYAVSFNRRTREEATGAAQAMHAAPSPGDPHR